MNTLYAKLNLASNDGTAIRVIVRWDGTEDGKAEARRAAYPIAKRLCPMMTPTHIVYEDWPPLHAAA